MRWPPGPVPDAARQLSSPFTGEPVASLRTVLAVKIDNLGAGPVWVVFTAAP